MPAKRDLQSRYAQEKPAPVVVHRLRTEDEMRKALALVESKKELLRIHADDDHDVVLQDVVTELLALRRIVTTFTIQVGTASQEASTAMKNMLNSLLQG